MNPPPGGQHWRRSYPSHGSYHPYSRGGWHNVRSEDRERYWPRYERDPAQEDHFYSPPQGCYSGYESYHPPDQSLGWRGFDTTDPGYPPPESEPVAEYGQPPTAGYGEDVQVIWRSHDTGAPATECEPFPGTDVSEDVRGTQGSCDQDEQSRIDCSADKAPSYEQHKGESSSPRTSPESSHNSEAHEGSCDSSHDMSSDIVAGDLEPANSKFQDEVKQFVAKRQVLLDKLLRDVGRKEEACPSSAICACGDWYADPNPLEFHMGVSWKLRRQKFFELLAPSDIVRGHVIMVRPHGVFVRVTSFMYSLKNRELPDLKIKGLVTFENLAGTQEECKKLLEELQEEDVVQAVVTGVDKDECLVELSFQRNHLPTDKQDVALGYLEDRKALTSRPRPEDDEYLWMLRGEPAFSNPDCTENLKAVLGLPASFQYSLMRPILMSEFPESEYFDSIRKLQRRKWSLESVAIGVKHFKAGELSAALRHFNHALEIDGKNVEGLVARGALYANQNRFKEAIKDLETALTINHNHRNAKNYLVETQIAYGKKLEEQGKLESALHCYKEALADNPKSEVAKSRLEFLTTVLERQAAEKKERERKREEEEGRLRKLQKIIKKERKREKRREDGCQERKRKHHTKKKWKTSDKTRKRKRHRHYTSSEDSGTSSGGSGSTSPSPRHKR